MTIDIPIAFFGKRPLASWLLIFWIITIQLIITAC